MDDTSSLESQEKVLVEKDGQFELVNAIDVQAEATVSATEQEAPLNTGHDEPTLVEPPDSFQEKNSTRSINANNNTDTVDSTLQEQSEPNDNATSLNTTSLAENMTVSSPTITSDRPATEEQMSTNHKVPTLKTTRSAIKKSKTRSSRNFTQQRSYSAPAKHANNERALLNETAFQMWIERKNAELLAKRQLERNQATPVESEEVKLQRNKEAFESWVRKKQRQFLSQQAKDAKPQNEISEEEKREKKEEIFRTWLKKKSEDRAKLLQLEEQKQKELNQMAEKTTPEVARRAYKQWLHRKSMEAKQEVARQKKCRKLFFQESRQLKKVLTHRFQGF